MLEKGAGQGAAVGSWCPDAVLGPSITICCKPGEVRLTACMDPAGALWRYVIKPSYGLTGTNPVKEMSSIKGSRRANPSAPALVGRAPTPGCAAAALPAALGDGAVPPGWTGIPWAVMPCRGAGLRWLFPNPDSSRLAVSVATVAGTGLARLHRAGSPLLSGQRPSQVNQLILALWLFMVSRI